MIRLILLSLLLVAGLLSGHYLVNLDGYVLVVLENVSLQISLMSAMLNLFLLLVAYLLLEWLIKRLFALFSGSRNWFGSWTERRHRKAFTQGLLALEETNYQEAEKQLSKLDSESFGGVDLLASAQAATKRKQWDKAMELWTRAAAFPASELAAKLHLIKLHLQQDRAKEALTLLEGLSEKHQGHPRVAQLWAKALAATGRWSELQDRLKGWKKTLGLEKYDALMRQAAQGIFADIASKEGANQLKLNWHNLPRAQRQDPAHQAAYAEQLMEQGMYQDAEQVLVDGQKQGPHPLLLPLFKRLKLANPIKAMRKLEEWLKRDENNLELVSTLGHLAYNCGDLGLAERALSKAIELDSRHEDLLLLAAIKEAQHDNRQALALYKQSLQG
ncbi:heme biosynthesis HemY N-terminal domain-containing protein [Aliiglaciecola sp. CAU 1673]|uniref:heme biosynthesis protein HemY n=1 Tax=Aliiglaciecola sp. CAU 1673 TaxID=3032595 RepID=UPI0023DA14A8|nr:heme biosynthesis HemY N-terminal domain-containing protein [Aliiglaciecola sp. CAU 1673]MDF2177961.1 heme biosynthesis HemY N-terminal domain-containing protein [Aliiglaciecola sp. CAU 1673]